MPEINLLQGNMRTPSNSSATRIVLSVIGALVLIGVVGGGIYLHSQVQSVQAQDLASVNAQATTQQSIVSDKNYTTFIASQKSLAALTTLFSNHVGWTALIPDLSNATLKTASFNSFQATSDGGVDISGSVPSFTDLDKLMQGFQLQDFNTFIKSVSLVSVGLQHSATGNTISFAIHVQFNPTTLKYSNQ